MTRLEKQCERIAKGFRPLTESQRRYAVKHGPAFVTLYRNRRYCSECGEELHGDICRECGTNHTSSTAFRMRKGRFTLRYYFRIEGSAEEVEYKRHWLVWKTAGMGMKPEHAMEEVTRNFLNERGRTAVQAVEVSNMAYIYDCWRCDTTMRTRPDTGSEAYTGRNFHLYAETAWPYGKPAEWLRKRGYVKPEQGYDRTLWQKRLATEPFAEWLQKKGLTRMLEIVTYERLKKFKRELELCHKNGYAISDIATWCDLVEENRELGRDTLNAKWSRPGDLDHAYSETVRAIRKKHERERREREKEELRQNAERTRQYDASRLKWSGLAISGKGIIIKPILTAEELYEEGKAMHHCAGGYWRHPESLVLSAKDSEGNKLATIEWDTQTQETVQCRGKCNGMPEKYGEIMELLRGMENAIMKAAASQKQKPVP